MSFDLKALRDAVARHGRVARIVVASVAGSAPRGVGTSMLVWADGEVGTIGGGALEFAAIGRARQQITGSVRRFEQMPLGPGLGQCCGGNVGLLTEIWEAQSLSQADETCVARPLSDNTQPMPLDVHRLLARARNSGQALEAGIVSGWMIEPITSPSRAIWIYGAGHVGRAIVDVLAPLPQVEVTWVDTGLDRFPTDRPENVSILPALNPADAVRLAPSHAEHYVLTYSHAFDLEICHQILGHSFEFAGLIGSKTKWARFRKRLAALGHRPEQITRITCPIGDPAFGKHPQEIAIGIAAAHLARATRSAVHKEAAHE